MKGACTANCGALTQCGNVCIDTQNDPNNCNACGTACANGLVCVKGACTANCGALTQCGNVCVDTKNDPNNCNSCGKVCGNGQTCQGGACVASAGKTYDIPFAQYDGPGNSCGTGSYYTQGVWGFHWTDAGAGTVAGLSIKINEGVDCSATPMAITLNGTNIGTLTHNGSYCSCTVRTSIVTLPISTFASYKVGALNTIQFAASTPWIGMAPTATFNNNYARVAVLYQ